MLIDFTGIEEKWKKHWAESAVYRVTHSSDRPKYYVLDMFPYPSGSGLHVGHPLGYIASDIVSRYQRMNGFNVLHPMGYDAFGLPAEQHAIQSGIHPATSTEENIRNFRSQMSNLGFSYDWDREIKTCDPAYYKWTQWIFLQLYHHFFDQEQNTARPISDLVARFEREGNAQVYAATTQSETFSATEWAAMSPKEKDEVLMNYRLAYRNVSYVNWCEELGTVLANDEVKDGVSERGGYPVERKPMLQWLLRITAYAQRLLDALDDLEWTESMKTIQTHWIGRSEGAEMDFKVMDSEHSFRIFTTRPDTIFGCTFMVIAPEHPLVDEITTDGQRQEIDAYLAYVKTRSERDRMADVKEVSGAFTGAFAQHPFSEAPIPIWIADYVLMDYGTGAIMAVPGDDLRDESFARHFDLPIVEVIDRIGFPDAEMQDKVGVLINSDFLNGMAVLKAIDTIISRLEKSGIGRKQVQYKMRDAIYSRQRYWGEPIPIVYDGAGVSKALTTDELPLELPELDNFQPAGTNSPLARVPEWVNTPKGTRETDTMPGYAGSSWYFLRYMDPHNDEAFASREALDYWRDVDLYIGGTEHAVGHLMYSRFWHKFLHDLGLVPTEEPFRKLINQGMIQAAIQNICLLKEKVDGHARFVSADVVGKYDSESIARIPIPVDLVTRQSGEQAHLTAAGIEALVAWRPEYADARFEHSGGLFSPGDAGELTFLTETEIGKMGKRYHNAVNPDDVVAEYGADCFRMYEMFLGPIDQSKPWDMQNIDGVSRFIKRLWGLYYDDQGKWIVTDQAPGEEALRVLHATIKKVRDDIDRFAFNTCISHFMTAVNEFRRMDVHAASILDPFVRLMAPFAPFISEELWAGLGHDASIHQSAYPAYEERFLKEDTIVYPVCINGKKRAEATVDAGAKKDDIESLVLDMEAVQKWIDGKEVRKVIIVPGRMINIVV